MHIRASVILSHLPGACVPAPVGRVSTGLTGTVHRANAELQASKDAGLNSSVNSVTVCITTGCGKPRDQLMYQTMMGGDIQQHMWLSRIKRGY